MTARLQLRCKECGTPLTSAIERINQLCGFCYQYNQLDEDDDE